MMTCSDGPILNNIKRLIPKNRKKMIFVNKFLWRSLDHCLIEDLITRKVEFYQFTLLRKIENKNKQTNKQKFHLLRFLPIKLNFQVYLKQFIKTFFVHHLTIVLLTSTTNESDNLLLKLIPGITNFDFLFKRHFSAVIFK